MMSGDNITWRIASRRGCELVNRLFPLSMDGRDPTAVVVAAVTVPRLPTVRLVGPHSPAPLPRELGSGVNLFAKRFHYLFALSSFSKKTNIRILHAHKCFCEKLSFIRNFKCFHKKIFAKREKWPVNAQKTALWKRHYRERWWYCAALACQIKTARPAARQIRDELAPARPVPSRPVGSRRARAEILSSFQYYSKSVSRVNVHWCKVQIKQLSATEEPG